MGYTIKCLHFDVLGCRLQPAIFFLFLSLTTMGLTSDMSEMRDYCDVDTFHAQCSNNKVVLMQEAIFGRMELGTCLSVDLGFMGCFRDVLYYMDRYCSGQISCEVPVTDLIHLTNPCTNDLRSYLQASFTCIPIAEHSGNCCQFAEARMIVRVGSGFLANSITLGTGCGSRDCPWQLQALEGQRINISIYDFGLYHSDDDEHSEITHTSGPCVVYATINEMATGAIVTVCRGGKRRRHVYTSTTSSIEIHFDEQIGNEMDVTYFVLEYGAFGCTDPSVPVHAQIHREGDHATISCPHPSDVSWEITCHNGQWKGPAVNCSTHISGSGVNYIGNANGNGTTNHNNKLQFGPRMIIILIVAAAIIIAVAIIAIGVVCVLSAMRIAKRRYPNKSSIPIKECGIKGYSDIPLGERDSTKAADQAGIPHYVHDWSKHNPPYISSPTLLTGYSDTCDIDKSHKQPYRDRSFSVGNREMECHDLDRIRAAACKAGSEYKTHV